MLKKYERVIKRVLNSTDPKKFPNFSKLTVKIAREKQGQR